MGQNASLNKHDIDDEFQTISLSMLPRFWQQLEHSITSAERMTTVERDEQDIKSILFLLDCVIILFTNGVGANILLKHNNCELRKKNL